MASIHPAVEGKYDGRTKIVLTEPWERTAAQELGVLGTCSGAVETHRASAIVSAIYNSTHNPEPGTAHSKKRRQP